MDYKEEQSKRMKLILLELDAENKRCADCSSGNVSHASINNGTIICTNCAEEHKKFETKISFLKAFSERWDDYLLSYVKMGSNGRFTQFSKSYRIDKMPIENKYRTRACEYYRDLLRSEVMGYDPPDGINIRTAGEIVDNIEDNYPEFAHYSYVKHVDLDNLDKKVTTSDDNGILGTVTGFFGNVTSKIDIAADYVAGLNVGEKIMEEGSKAINSMKNVVNENTKKLQGLIDEIVGPENEKEEGKENSETFEEEKETNQEEQKTQNNNKTNKEETKEGIKDEIKLNESKEDEIVEAEINQLTQKEVVPTLKIDQETKKSIESEKDDF